MAEHANLQVGKAIEQRLRDRVPGLTVLSALEAESEIQSHEIPLVAVQIGDVATPVTGGPRVSKAMRRDLTVVVQLLVQGRLEDRRAILSALQVDVEKALEASDDPILPGVHDWTYGNSIPPIGSPEAGTAATNLTYTCWLRTNPGRPDIIVI